MTTPGLVTVTWDVTDASLAALGGTITFAPVAILDGASVATPVTITDAADQLIIAPAGVTRTFSAGFAELVPTDNSNLQPAGWMYLVTTAITGLAPTSQTYLIPHSPSPVDLSSLAPAVAVEATQPYLLGTFPGGTTEFLRADGTWDVPPSGSGGLPSGATAGQVLTATDGTHSFWEPAAAPPVNLLIPAYQYPTTGALWADLTAAPVKYAVANISSGPGTGPANTDYTAAISAAQAAGVVVLGYVDTNFGAISSGTVAANVALWSSLYGVTSIFLDRAAASTGELSYYTTVTSAIRSADPSGTIVLNHGAIPNQGYAALGDVLVVFENAQSAWSAFTPASWFTQYPPSKFAVLAYSASTQAVMSATITQAQGFGIGNAYVTADAGLWNTVPAYWAAEVAQSQASAGAVLGQLAIETTRAEAAESTNATAITAETSRAETAEALLAPKASPALTGTPTAPTASALTSTTQLATTAFTTGAVATETTRATAAEGTNATAISTETTRAEGAESTTAAAVTTETSRAETAEGLLAPKASPALTGVPTAPTAAALTSTTQLASTAYADSAVAVEASRATTAEGLKAPLASPALTGTPTAPTKTALTNNTDIATTAYADAAVAVELARAETAEALALPKTGGTMSGALTLAADPASALQAATQQYAQSRVGESPSDRGYLAWTWNPQLPGRDVAMSTIPAGDLYLTKIWLREAATVSTISLYIGGTIGSGMTSAQNFAGLYDSTGTRQGVTADQTTAWTTTGNKSAALPMNLVTPYAAAAGFYWIVLVWNGGTTPTIAISNAANTNAVNFGLTAATAMSGFISGSNTTLPSSLTPSSIQTGAGNSFPFLAALS